MQKDLCAGLFSAKMAFHTPHLYKSFASFKNTVLRNKNTPNAGTLTNISLNSFAFFGAFIKQAKRPCPRFVCGLWTACPVAADRFFIGACLARFPGLIATGLESLC